jgi:hypothetical protein
MQAREPCASHRLHNFCPLVAAALSNRISHFWVSLQGFLCGGLIWLSFERQMRRTSRKTATRTPVADFESTHIRDLVWQVDLAPRSSAQKRGRKNPQSCQEKAYLLCFTSYAKTVQVHFLLQKQFNSSINLDTKQQINYIASATFLWPRELFWEKGVWQCKSILIKGCIDEFPLSSPSGNAICAETQLSFPLFSRRPDGNLRRARGITRTRRYLALLSACFAQAIWIFRAILVFILNNTKSRSRWNN